MPSNDPRDSKATAPATWGLIFGLLTGSACSTPQVDHSQRPICDDPAGATVDPCDNECFGYSAFDLPDGGRCVVSGSIGWSSAVDAGPEAKRYACGFCNG